jgi:hypothetical protein
VAFGKVYTAKTPVTVPDLLNDRVLPFFEEQKVPVLRVLTDRGTQFDLFSTVSRTISNAGTMISIG